MRFHSPLAFLLLLIIAAVYIARVYLHPKGGVTFSSASFGAVKKSLKQQLAVLPQILRILALILLVVALARPQAGIDKEKNITNGVAIEMVIDRSGSMGQSMGTDGGPNRLDVVKEVFADFISGKEGGLAGRPNDLIGLVTFARYADTLCPLTLSHETLEGFTKSMKLVTIESEDGTSIGDAIALAAARLKTAEKDLAGKDGDGEGDYNIKSKIMILLTDGRNNAGERSPLQSAELAKKWGIKIYAIGIGRSGYVTVDTIFGKQQVYQQGVDEATLQQVAELTGGKFFLADDKSTLEKIYAEIDSLEMSEIETLEFVDYKELFFPFALAALILFVIEMILSNTIFRRLP